MFFRTSTAPAFNQCAICGVTGEPMEKQHDPAVHEVYAYETWGMHSVRSAARPFVTAWASGQNPLPTREDFHARLSA